MELLLTNTGIVALLIWMIVTGIFVLAQLLKDNSIMDIFYGPIFAVVAWLFLFLTKTDHFLSILFAIGITLWAVRLGGRILIKNFGKPEDVRYANWRREWMQKGRTYFLVRSYVQISLLQGFIILLVLLPFIISTTTADVSVPPAIVGGLIFLLGLTWETIADWQLDQFIKRKKAGVENNSLMKQGLFSLSRRPNYFGESLVWWGQAVMVLSLPYGLIALLSPVVITLVLVRISGPMIEKIFLEKYPDEYRQYMATTNFIIPGPKKKSTS